MKKLLLLFAASVLLMLTACMPEGSAARNFLQDYLDDNPTASADEMLDFFHRTAFLRPANEFFVGVEIPRSDVDQRPLTGGAYYGENDSVGTRFVLFPEVQDSIITIGELVHDGDATRPADNYRNLPWHVQARGRSIYTVYYHYNTTDSLGNETTHLGYLPAVYYVYPGGQEILVTEGHKISTTKLKFRKD